MTQGKQADYLRGFHRAGHPIPLRDWLRGRMGGCHGRLCTHLDTIGYRMHATIRAALEQDLRTWDPTRGTQDAWTKEIAWSRTAAIDLLTTSPEFRARYFATRGRPVGGSGPNVAHPGADARPRYRQSR